MTSRFARLCLNGAPTKNDCPMNDTMHFLTGCGGLAVFAVVFADQAGLPVPAPPVLLAAGALVAAGKLDAALATVMAATAAIMADSLWYCLGRKSGRRAVPVLARWAQSHNVSFANAKAAVERHGLWALMIAKFLPGTVMPSVAGALGMSARRFLLFDSLAALFYSGCYIACGFLFHNQVQQAMVWFDRVCHGVIGLGIVLVVGYVGYKYALRRKGKRPDKKRDSADQGIGVYAAIPRLDTPNLAAEE
jgi:membrane protein DedA with SNARE-associated domain